MDVFISLIISIFEEGFIYGIMAIGVYITYKVLDFPDLTVAVSYTHLDVYKRQDIINGMIANFEAFHILTADVNDKIYFR